MVDFGASEAGKLGGKARAESLTPEQRSEIARHAVKARWEKSGKLKPVAQATHGSPDRPLRIGNIDIPCYVLNDKRRVLVQRGMLTALAMSQGTAGKRGGDRLASFIESKSLKTFVNKDLAEMINNPIRFQTPTGNEAYGYEATILADICDTVLEARKHPGMNYQTRKIAEQCEILVRGFARVGIIALVDEATGYQDDRDRQALAKILEAFVAKELRKWVKTFPVDYYRELCRLWQVPFSGNLKRPQFFGTLTNNLVYARLAPGVLAELRARNPLTENGYRKHKHFQWLTSDVGHPALREHLSAVVALMRASPNKEKFLEMVDLALPKYKPMPLFDGEPDKIEVMTTSELPALPESEVTVITSPQ